MRNKEQFLRWACAIINGAFLPVPRRFASGSGCNVFPAIVKRGVANLRIRGSTTSQRVDNTEPWVSA